MAQQAATAAATPASLEPAIPRIKIDPQDRPTDAQSLTLWLLGASARGYYLSAFLHSAALLLLSIIVATGQPGDNGRNALLVSTDATDHDQPGFDQAIDTRIDLEGGTSAPLEPAVTLLQPLQAEGDLNVAALPDPGMANTNLNPPSGAGRGIGDLIGDGERGGGFAMPAPGSVVSRGSFSAWTVPEDPGPGQDYLIVIHVRLPSGRLRMGDVSGTVIGTDRYRQRISQYSRFTRYIPKANQIVVEVPGGQALVRDVIQVKSAVLKESQTLEIEF